MRKNVLRVFCYETNFYKNEWHSLLCNNDLCRFVGAHGGDGGRLARIHFVERLLNKRRRRCRRRCRRPKQLQDKCERQKFIINDIAYILGTRAQCFTISISFRSHIQFKRIEHQFDGNGFMGGLSIDTI